MNEGCNQTDNLLDNQEAQDQKVDFLDDEALRISMIEDGEVTLIVKRTWDGASIQSLRHVVEAGFGQNTPPNIPMYWKRKYTSQHTASLGHFGELVSSLSSISCIEAIDGRTEKQNISFNWEGSGILKDDSLTSTTEHDVLSTAISIVTLPPSHLIFMLYLQQVYLPV